MTYCCGLVVRDGLVMIADTRTNAGLDNISIFRKLHVYGVPGQRIMALASSGNLSLSQSVVSTLTEGIENPKTGEVETLLNAPTMFQAAQRIGHAIRDVHDKEAAALNAADVQFDVSFLFGGQIKGDRLRLFMVYGAGNFIESTIDTPYLQIGEHKYGKPVLDRAVTYSVDLYDALKIGLISMDSTMRSNLGVGMPIDLLVVWREIRTRLARIWAGGGDSRVRRSAVAPIVLIIVFAVVCVIVAVQWSAYRADEVALHQERQLFAQAIAQRRAEILRDVESIVVSDNSVNRLWNDFDWTWVHNRVGLRLKNYFEQSHVFVVDSSDRFAYAMAGRSGVGPKWFGVMTAQLAPVIDAVRGRPSPLNAEDVDVARADAASSRRPAHAARVQM